MGKPRRPRGGRPASGPKPPLVTHAPVETGAETPTTETPGPEVATADAAEVLAVETDAVAPAEAGAEALATETPASEIVTAEVLAVEATAIPESLSMEPAAQAAPEAFEPLADPQPEPSAAAIPDSDAEPVVQAEPAPSDDTGSARLPGMVAPLSVAAATQPRIVFAPERWDVVEIGSTIARYMRGEGAAALAHLRALSDARTPADLIRLQVGEAQRAADASLTCWVTVIGKASRVVAFR